MARNTARPGRTLTVFFIGLAIAYGLVALIGTWKPALGLDLQGGTQITLTAKGNVSKDNLNEAANIIDSASTAPVSPRPRSPPRATTRSWSRSPARRSDNLVEIVERQAQLRFRLVAPGAPEHDDDPAPVVVRRRPAAGVTAAGAAPKSVEVRGHGEPTGKNRPPALLGKDKATKNADHADRQRRSAERPARAPARPTAPGSGGNVPDLHQPR